MSNDKDQTKENGEVSTIEIVEKPATEEGKSKVTADELLQSGMNAEEVKLAEKHGLIEKPAEEGKEKEEKKEKKKDGEEKKEGEKSKEVLKSAEEIEAEKLGKFNANEKALYFAQKKERRKRQDAEAERDKTVVQIRAQQEKIDLLQKSIEDIKALKSGAVSGKEKDDFDAEMDNLLSEGAESKAGAGKDKHGSDGKPLTEESFKKLREGEKKADAETRERAAKLKARLDEQAEEAKLVYTDFDNVLELTNDVMKNAETLFEGQPKMMAKVKRLVRSWYVAAATAADEELDENAADIAYEIGQLHPKYKPGSKESVDEKKADSGKKDGEDNSAGEKKADSKMERMLENAQKRNSSASLSGGGKRSIPVEDITMEQAAQLSNDEWRKLPKHVKDKLLGKVG